MPAHGSPPQAKKNRSIKIGAEVGVTLQVDEFQFVRFSYHSERIAPNDDPSTIKKYEQMLFAHCEEVVEKRAKRLKRMIRSMK